MNVVRRLASTALLAASLVLGTPRQANEIPWCDIACTLCLMDPVSFPQACLVCLGCLLE